MNCLNLCRPGVLFAVCLASISAHADQGEAPRTVERIVWDKTPIPIVLPVGVERRVAFPAAVRVGVPVEIQTKIRTLSAGGTVYWQASESFGVTRIQVQDIESGEMVLIDLSAIENDPALRSTPIEIVTSKSDPAPQAAAAEETAGPDYVTLTRFAAQQLYAPQRLLTTPPDIHRAATPRGSVTLFRGLPIEATPVAAWRGGSLHVTAVKLRNLGPEPVILDPRSLRGTWLAATFQHARLHPAGSEADATAVYLISARPFEESL
jgi:integrating conjugative element protein (TIGR03749 family)